MAWVGSQKRMRLGVDLSTAVVGPTTADARRLSPRGMKGLAN